MSVFVVDGYSNASAAYILGRKLAFPTTECEMSDCGGTLYVPDVRCGRAYGDHPGARALFNGGGLVAVEHIASWLDEDAHVVTELIITVADTAGELQYGISLRDDTFAACAHARYAAQGVDSAVKAIYDAIIDDYKRYVVNYQKSL